MKTQLTPQLRTGGTFLSSTGLNKFIPEPKNRSGFMKALEGIGGSLLGGVTQFSGLDPTYSSLLNKQIEMQQQLQLVSLYSNIEKSRHESKMAAIRNVRSA
ncbi:MAG: hypothetical protein KDD64_01610 [Bdellovibrionales bacterium]|nr:hypothetical protein [Bdellovibrionales bacterium]